MNKKIILKHNRVFNKILALGVIVSLVACASEEKKPDPEPEPEPKVVEKPKPKPKLEPPKEKEKPKEVIPETKKILLNFIPSKKLNINRGKSYPLRVVAYQLKSNLNFNAHGFRAIVNKEAQSLKSDVLDKKEWRFQPNEPKKTYVWDKINTETQYIGFVAYYMDISHAKWQAIYKLDDKLQNKITISLTSKKIIVKK